MPTLRPIDSKRMKFMAHVDSPCTGVCELDLETDWCKGCFRTRDEVATWSLASDDQKKSILINASARRSHAVKN